MEEREERESFRGTEGKFRSGDEFLGYSFRGSEKIERALEELGLEFERELKFQREFARESKNFGLGR